MDHNFGKLIAAEYVQVDLPAGQPDAPSNVALPLLTNFPEAS
jgi:hypothetical protein